MFSNYHRIRNNFSHLPPSTPQQITTNNRRFLHTICVGIGSLFMVGCYFYTSRHGMHMELP